MAGKIYHNQVFEPSAVEGNISSFDSGGSLIDVGKKAEYIIAQKYNHTAIIDPTVNDDLNLGYGVGSEWINIISGEIFKCVSSAVGAADWKSGSSSSSGQSNTFSSAGTGVSIPYLKVNDDLRFNAIKSENNMLSIVLDAVSHDIEFTIVPTNIDHNTLTNYSAIEHLDWSISQTSNIHIDNLPPVTDTAAIHDNTQDEINQITEKLVPELADYVLIEDSNAGWVKRKVLLGNLPSASGGEINTASNAGTGVSLYYQKDTYDLQFNSVSSANALLTVALNSTNHDIVYTLNESSIDHDNLDNTHNLTTDIDHDALTNFVTLEHVNHSSVSMIAGVGLTGGGDLTIDRTFDVDIPGLTAETVVDNTADYVILYDASATAHRKVLVQNLPTGSGTYSFTHSLVNNSGTVSLVNDTASPTASQYYGTNVSSTRGWNNLPTNYWPSDAGKTLTDGSYKYAMGKTAANSIQIGIGDDYDALTPTGSQLYFDYDTKAVWLHNADQTSGYYNIWGSYNTGKKWIVELYDDWNSTKVPVLKHSLNVDTTPGGEWSVNNGTISMKYSFGVNGLFYDANYSGRWGTIDDTNRFIPDIGHVSSYLVGKPASTTLKTPTSFEDDYVIYWDDATGEFDLKAETLLALTDGSGTIANGTAVDLGGTLTTDAYILVSSSYDLMISNVASGSPTYPKYESKFSDSGIELLNRVSSTTYYGLDVGSSGVELKAYNGSSTAMFYATISGLSISDGINSKGVRYNSDYSTVGEADNFWLPSWGSVKDYWTVDQSADIHVNNVPVFSGDSGSGGAKGLVPAPVAGDSTKFLRGNGSWADEAVYTASNGLTMSSNDIKFGGTLADNTIILGNNKFLYFGSPGGNEFSQLDVYTNDSINFLTGGNINIDADNILYLRGDNLQLHSIGGDITVGPGSDKDFHLYMSGSGKSYYGSYEIATLNDLLGDSYHDGKMYGRQDGYWMEITVMPDAPWDSKIYGRRNYSWVEITGSGGIPEAPSDNAAYVRRNAAWEVGYLKTAVDALLGGKANTSHTHTASEITNFQTSVTANTNVSSNTAVRLSSDEYDAAHGAASPSSTNVFATMADISGNVSIKRTSFTATSGQTDFVMPGAVTNEIVEIMVLTVEGDIQANSEYVVTSTTVTRDTVSFSSGLTAGDTVVVEYFHAPANVASDMRETPVVIKGANYAVRSVDLGKIIEVSTTATITLPIGLSMGFNCVVVNIGTGIVTISTSGTATFDSKDNKDTITSRYGAATIYNKGSNKYIGFGDLV